MPVRIRLARFGQKNRPFYRIFVCDSRSKRDGKHLEVVGHYDPIPSKDRNKHVGLNVDRVKYWLSVGAQPSDTVRRILSQTGIIPPRPIQNSSLSVTTNSLLEQQHSPTKTTTTTTTTTMK